MIFRERLISAQEKSQYDTIVQKHLPGAHPRMFYRPKMRSEGIYLERLDEDEWYRHTQKTINQCCKTILILLVNIIGSSDMQSDSQNNTSSVIDSRREKTVKVTLKRSKEPHDQV